MLKTLARRGAIVGMVMVCSGLAASADQAPAAATGPTVTRTVLNQQDLPTPGMASRRSPLHHSV